MLMATWSAKVIVAFVVIILAVIAAATYLTATGHFSEDSISQVFTLILGSIGLTGIVHVGGQTVTTYSAVKNGKVDPASVIDGASVPAHDHATKVG